MAVKSPRERVYYSECSYGAFQLSLYIPINELEELADQGRIKRQVLEDFPDGVDLGVSESDYNDFYQSYNYRPEVGAVTAKTLFYTLYTSTRNWRNYRGTDLIPATILEASIKGIETSLEKHVELQRISPMDLRLTAGADQRPKEALKRYRESKKNLSREENDLLGVLRRHTPKGIDPKKTLHDQDFSIEYSDGDRIDDVISRIQRRGKHSQ
ncbi:hypothetical protein E4H04_09090 [Candidatus Bathyarchaeota archaeon]|nr:MAG: hypothetical protein E4H04_09090 [Candidatus Bathyarchaeota archaeon]